MIESCVLIYLTCCTAQDHVGKGLAVAGFTRPVVRRYCASTMTNRAKQATLEFLFWTTVRWRICDWLDIWNTLVQSAAELARLLRSGDYEFWDLKQQRLYPLLPRKCLIIAEVTLIVSVRMMSVRRHVDAILTAHKITAAFVHIFTFIDDRVLTHATCSMVTSPQIVPHEKKT
ncbi:hypothetical protein AVEN_151497-1 [Araneus ventricosus]|uniref:Uncharacterized protein n=1 Tax=Araneus ventricosus TaxID=182803 RepID=A0A4Y2HZK0_ARAVE|nr:hypothetical protein AVEN_151497-1 [Araneus ventricosus]